jgi:hypothetical protein
LAAIPRFSTSERNVVNWVTHSCIPGGGPPPKPPPPPPKPPPIGGAAIGCAAGALAGHGACCGAVAGAAAGALFGHAACAGAGGCGAGDGHADCGCGLLSGHPACAFAATADAVVNAAAKARARTDVMALISRKYAAGIYSSANATTRAEAMAGIPLPVPTRIIGSID